MISEVIEKQNMEVVNDKLEVEIQSNQVKDKSKKKIALLVQYVGTNYGGWQKQDNAPTVQDELEKALTRLCKEPIRLQGCSRTDAGVHARFHISHFISTTTMPIEKIHIAMNTILPGDITVMDAKIVDMNFNARFDTIGKKYSYYIWNNTHKSAFLTPYSIQESRDLDLAAMRKAAKYLEGEHDFQGFMSQGSPVNSTIRELFEVTVHGEKGQMIRIDVKGNAFLYNMVRIIAGTLLYVGLGKINADDISDIILSGRRELAGKTLAAKGLFLEEVYYDNELFNEWYNGEQNLVKYLGM